MKKKTKKNKRYDGRAKGQTQISISLPESLVSKIDKQAEQEHRNRSNFIVKALSECVH